MGFFFDDVGSDVHEWQCEPWRLDLIDQLGKVDSQGIHNFSLGSYIAYFKLLSLPREAISWDGRVLVLTGLPGASKRKVYAYGAEPDLKALSELQASGVIYAQAKLNLPKRSAFAETVYNLDEVFAPTSYANARKRHKRLVQPFARLEREGITLRPGSSADMPAVTALHQAWVQHKMDDPTTMRNMFPKARYLNCMRIALEQQVPGFLTLLATNRAGDLISARCMHRAGDTCYDLAFFSRQWDFYSNIVEDIAILTLRHLEHEGVAVLNCGASLNRNLSAFKSHWPSSKCVSYAYGKLTG